MALLIGDIVSDAATATPEGTAATLDTETISFAALDEQANRLAGALCGTGIEHGDIVAWWSGPALHNLTGMLACARLGAVFAPLSPHLTADEARDALDYIGPRLLTCDAAHLEGGHALGIDLAAIGTHAQSVYDLDARSAAATGTAPVVPELIDDDPHILYLTSGSTGSPKGVLVSHRASWLRSCPGGGTFATGLHGSGGVLCSFPLYHYGGWHYVLEAWLNRTAVHLARKADATQLIGTARRHRPTAIYCIPAVWERVLAEPGDLSFVRHADTGTSAVSADLLGRISERMPGATTSVLYGATEAGRMTVLRPWERIEQRGSVGRAVAPGLVTIADDGEILFRGPTLMTGYLRLTEQTQQSVRGGWYHTGDLGYQDGDGYVFITGRKREVIRSAGETISPAEVEGALHGLHGVDDLAVIGLPDDRWGEIVCAAVVPTLGRQAPSIATLRARLRALAPYKHPRAVATVRHIPRTTATGQVVRTQLLETVLEGRTTLQQANG